MAGDQLKLGQLLVERPAADVVVPALPQHRLDFSPRHLGQQVDGAIGSLRSQGTPGEWRLGALPAEYFDLYPAGRLRTLRFLAGTGRPERLPDTDCCPRRHCPQVYVAPFCGAKSRGIGRTGRVFARQPPSKPRPGSRGPNGTSVLILPQDEEMVKKGSQLYNSPVRRHRSP